MNRFIYAFSDSFPFDNERYLLGNKGASLMLMTRQGFPVPDGFILTTDLCRYVLRYQDYPEGFEDSLLTAVRKLEEFTGLTLGSCEKPLLISVRSGAPSSMPGMMDTVLNLGLNDTTVAALAHQYGDEHFALDSYRRFIQMYSDVVLGLPRHSFEEIVARYRALRHVQDDSDLKVQDLQAIITDFHQVISSYGVSFPSDPFVQLSAAIRAVIQSWMNPRAVTYRSLYNIPETLGTAVIIQRMVFGNKGPRSATGVAFSRHPATGEAGLFGEYLPMAQGEDVVAGTRTPYPLRGSCEKSLETQFPKAYSTLEEMASKLEHLYHDMQDIEFTIEDDNLWLLQTRHGKRTAAAALKIAVDLVQEGLSSPDQVIKHVEAHELRQLLSLHMPSHHQLVCLGQGLPASPGAATGRVSFSGQETSEGSDPFILVREETSPEDIQGMVNAAGVLTARGGMTSHAAVVARGIGKPCVVGTPHLHLNLTEGTLTLGETVIRSGDWITLDGTTGEIFLGQTTLKEPELPASFESFMKWVDQSKRMTIKANGETPTDFAIAKRLGAQGIGLCRTEHMFFESERLMALRVFLLGYNPHEREKALYDLNQLQIQDFIALFEAAGDLPLTVRLLDPPLHEFLPLSDSAMNHVAHEMGLSLQALRQRVEALAEHNSMLGCRGCRLGLYYPELYKAQVKALFQAANVVRPVHPVGVMIPFIVFEQELLILKEMISQEADLFSVPYRLGAMIEVPRAALRAGQLAAHLDFMSFGTNDLTQMTLGLSRDDSSRFLSAYKNMDILPNDPFMSLDLHGVGELMSIACERARATNPSIEINVCGEQAADPQSILFFETLGITSLSCSPFSLPTARLAAAQAAISKGSKN